MHRWIPRLLCVEGERHAGISKASIILSKFNWWKILIMWLLGNRSISPPLTTLHFRINKMLNTEHLDTILENDILEVLQKLRRSTRSWGKGFQRGKYNYPCDGRWTEQWGKWWGGRVGRGDVCDAWSSTSIQVCAKHGRSGWSDMRNPWYGHCRCSTSPALKESIIGSLTLATLPLWRDSLAHRPSRLKTRFLVSFFYHDNQPT